MTGENCLDQSMNIDLQSHGELVDPLLSDPSQCQHQELISENKSLKEQLLNRGDELKNVERANTYHALKHKEVCQLRDAQLKELKKLESQCCQLEQELAKAGQRNDKLVRRNALLTIERDKALLQRQQCSSNLNDDHNACNESQEEDENVPNDVSTVGTSKQVQDKSTNTSKIFTGNFIRVPTRQSTGVDNGRRIRPPVKQSDGVNRSQFILPPDRHQSLQCLLNDETVSKTRSIQSDSQKRASLAVYHEVVHHNAASISCLAQHPSQALLCSTSDQGDWCLWTTPDLQPLLTVDCRSNNWLSSASFHPTDSLVAAAGSDSLVAMTVEAFQALYYTVYNSQLWSYTIDHDSFDSSSCLSLSFADHRSSSTLIGQLGRHGNGCHQHRVRGHTRPVLDIDWHSTGQWLVSAGSDGLIALWDVETGSRLSVARPARDPVVGCSRSSSSRWPVRSATFLPGGSNLVVCTGSDYQIRLWDARMNQFVHRFVGHAYPVYCAKFNNQCNQMVSCDASGCVRIWDLRKATVNKSTTTTTTASSGLSRLYKFYDIKDQRRNSVTGLRRPVAKSAVFNRTGTTVAVGASNNSLGVIIVETDEMEILRGRGASIESVFFNYQHDCLYSASSNGRITSWKYFYC